jgi:hypothetical protein
VTGQSPGHPAATAEHGDRLNDLRGGSAEGEDQGLHTRIEELDLELSITDVSRLPDQLIQPLVRDRADPVVVHVAAVGSAGRPAVEQYPESRGNPLASPVT